MRILLINIFFLSSCVLAEVPLFTLTDSTFSFGGQYGENIVGLGDVNSDGFDDLAVSGNSVAIRFVRVLSGKDGRQIYQIPLPSPTSLGGINFALSAVKDVNGDGITDIAVGDSSQQAYTGFVYVYSGQNGSSIATLNGPSINSYFGSEVISPGDLNGDNFSDIIVSFGGIVVTPTVLGGLQIFYGPNLSSGPIISGPPGHSDFGNNTAPAGDLNQDNVGDFFVASPLAQLNGVPAGAIAAYSGATLSPLWTISGISSSLGIFGGSFGLSMTSGFDMTGDGVPDLLASDRVPFNILQQPNLVRLVDGATGANVSTVPGGTAFGHFMAMIPDMTGDSIAEAALSDNPPGTYEIKVIAGGTGQLLQTISGGSFPGIVSDLNYIGDLNSDGSPDIGIGEANTIIAMDKAQVYSLTDIAHVFVGCGNGSFPPQLNILGTPQPGNLLLLQVFTPWPNTPGSLVVSNLPSAPTLLSSLSGVCHLDVNLSNSFSIPFVTNSNGAFVHPLFIPNSSSMQNQEFSAQAELSIVGGPVLALHEVSNSVHVKVN